MKTQTAAEILAGQRPPEGTPAELMQLAMNACLTDDGDIVCMQCGRPNECCECGSE